MNTDDSQNISPRQTEAQGENSTGQLETPVLFGFARYRQTEKGMKLRPVWKRLFAAGTICFVSLWALKSAAIFGIFKYSRGYDDITVSDAVLFPLNRYTLARKFGEQQIAEARLCMANGDIQKALFLLRTGLGRSPSNMQARLDLATVMRSIGQDEIALSLYKGGLQYHSDNANYMNVYLNALYDYRMDAELCAYAEERLAHAPDKPSNAELVIAYWLARDKETQGDFIGSTALIRQYTLDRMIEGLVLLSRNYWRCGERERAIGILQQHIYDRINSLPDLAYQELYRYYVESNRCREATLCALNHASSSPTSPLARRELIESYRRDGDDAKAENETRNFLRTFAGSTDALSLLMDYAIRSHRADLARDIYGLAAENTPQLAFRDITLCDALASGGDYASAVRNCDLIESDSPRWLGKLQDQFDYLRTVSAHARGQESVAAIHLDALLNSDKLTPANMLAIAKRMRTFGMDQGALKLLEHALTLDTNNDELLVEILKIQMDDRLDSNFVKHVDSLLGLRLPDIDVLQSIRKRLNSDHFIFDPSRDEVLARLDATIGAMNAARASLPR